MPTPSTLRKRLALIADLDQLASRLDNRDPAAIEETQDHIAGLTLCDDPNILAMVIRAMARVLTDMQQELDRGGWTFGGND
jgi:hypothetical protein